MALIPAFSLKGEGEFSLSLQGEGGERGIRKPA
jgi:hypothetical protein